MLGSQRVIGQNCPTSLTRPLRSAVGGPPAGRFSGARRTGLCSDAQECMYVCRRRTTDEPRAWFQVSVSLTAASWFDALQRQMVQIRNFLVLHPMTWHIDPRPPQEHPGTRCGH